LQNELRAAENVFPFSLHAHIVSYLLAIARLEAAGDLCGVPTVADTSIILGVLIARVADETRQMAGAIEVVRTGQLIWRLNPDVEERSRFQFSFVNGHFAHCLIVAIILHEGFEELVSLLSMNGANLPGAFYQSSCLQSLDLAHDYMLIRRPLRLPRSFISNSNNTVSEPIDLDAFWRHMTEKATDVRYTVEAFGDGPHLKPLSSTDLRVLSFEWLVHMHFADVKAGQLRIGPSSCPDVLRYSDGHITVQPRRSKDDTITLMVAENGPESGICDAGPNDDGRRCVGGVNLRNDALA
jgi:hypothetical protein